MDQILKASEKYHATEELAGCKTSQNNIARMGTILWFLIPECAFIFSTFHCPVL